MGQKLIEKSIHFWISGTRNPGQKFDRILGSNSAGKLIEKSIHFWISGTRNPGQKIDRILGSNSGQNLIENSIHFLDFRYWKSQSEI